MGFVEVALIILNMVKKSITVEVMDYFRHTTNVIVKSLRIPTRQAFTKAREKISYHAFADLFKKSCELTLLSNDDTRHYKGYRVFAVDGTSFVVGKLKKLSKFFGESTTIANKAMCRISAVVDVLNDCIVDAQVAGFCIGERALAIKQTKALKDVKVALYLFDRGYWSPELVAGIIQNGQKFLMRVAKSAGRAIVRDAQGKEVVFRRYSFTLPSGITELLLTNLTEEEMSNDELVALYAKRWGAETKYLELKDRLQIDKFSGKSENIVLQDIYATLYISNLVAFISFEADELIKARTAGKGNKHEQKANRTTCISILRRRFVNICLITNAAQQLAALQCLYDDISRDVVYIGKSKSRPRNKRQIKASRGRVKKSIL